MKKRAEVAVLTPGGGPGDLDERGLEPGSPMAQARGASLARALVAARAHPRPGQQVARGRKDAHVGSDLGEQHGRGRFADAGDGRQLRDFRWRKGAVASRACASSSWIRAVVELIDLAKVQLEHEAVMLGQRGRPAPRAIERRLALSRPLVRLTSTSGLV